MSMLEGLCILLAVSEHPVLQSQALQVLDHGESVGDLLHTAETNVPHPEDVDVKTEYYGRDKISSTSNPEPSMACFPRR